LVALAHTLLRIIYHLLLDKRSYLELGSDYLERFNSLAFEKKQAQMIRQLEASGFIVSKSA
jgi:hypothetical protein